MQELAATIAPISVVALLFYFILFFTIKMINDDAFKINFLSSSSWQPLCLRYLGRSTNIKKGISWVLSSVLTHKRTWYSKGKLSTAKRCKSYRRTFLCIKYILWFPPFTAMLKTKDVLCKRICGGFLGCWNSYISSKQIANTLPQLPVNPELEHPPLRKRVHCLGLFNKWLFSLSC